jgi:hypothetical protein
MWCLAPFSIGAVKPLKKDIFNDRANFPLKLLEAFILMNYCLVNKRHIDLKFLKYLD